MLNKDSGIDQASKKLSISPNKEPFFIGKLYMHLVILNPILLMEEVPFELALGSKP